MNLLHYYYAHPATFLSFPLLFTVSYLENTETKGPMPAELGNTSQRQSNHNFIFKSCSLADSAPHPFYTIYTTKSPQKCTKQNAISRKRNTACLYAACLYVCMPPTGCWPACPSSCRLSSRCLSPACRFAISLPDICPHPVCVPAAHPFGLSSPPSLHSIHNKMPTKKHQTECYKSEEKHCLSICLLSVCPPVA